MIRYFDFEHSIEQIDKKIIQLINNKDENSIKKIKNYNEEKNIKLKKIYSQLNAWQKVQIARHPDRPHCLDYVNSNF